MNKRINLEVWVSITDATLYACQCCFENTLYIILYNKIWYTTKFGYNYLIHYNKLEKFILNVQYGVLRDILYKFLRYFIVTSWLEKILSSKSLPYNIMKSKFVLVFGILNLWHSVKLNILNVVSRDNFRTKKGIYFSSQ